MKTIACALILLFFCACSWAQLPQMARLFQEEAPLEIKFSIGLETLRRTTTDSIYFPTSLVFKNDEGQWDSIQMNVRARGNFRRKNCSVPPLRIKIAKGAGSNTIFEGIKSLKLVLPCHTSKNGDDLILKEYVCYQLCEPTTPYVFGTRLVDITLVDLTGKNDKTFHLKGFFIEDDDAVAKRFQAKVVDVDKLHPLLLMDTCSIRFDLFQYMIGNTDFSTTFFHNAKVIKMSNGKYIPIPYDFDMSGFVNAPYATYDPQLSINSVRERVYRGFCRNDEVAEFVRQEYLVMEPKILEVIDHHKEMFDPREFASVKKYMNDFFATIKNDAMYRQRIKTPCRTR